MPEHLIVYAPSEIAQLADPSLDQVSIDQPESSSNEVHCAILDDLQSRVEDWKGHPLSSLGDLKLHVDKVVVHDSDVHRAAEYAVYVFDRTILFVCEKKKKWGNVLKRASKLISGWSHYSKDAAADTLGSTDDLLVHRPKLVIEGRLYMGYIKSVQEVSKEEGGPGIVIETDVSVPGAGAPKLTLLLSDLSVADTWKTTIDKLADPCRKQVEASRPPADIPCNTM